MKGADTVMANIVHHSEWLEEEVCLDFKYYFVMLLHNLMFKGGWSYTCACLIIFHMSL